jgi:hypothetical protein
MHYAEANQRRNLLQVAARPKQLFVEPGLEDALSLKGGNIG